jgi:hypothetical protein
MESEVYRARIIAKQSLNNVKSPIKESKKDKKETVKLIVKETIKPKTVKETNNIASKVILCYVGKKVVAEYDSISKCATALNMSRPMVKNAIDNGTILENGFKLVFK